MVRVLRLRMCGVNSEYEIIFAPRALKQLQKLDKTAQIRIKEGIIKLANYPPEADVRKLKGGMGNEFKLRVGNWRIIFEYQFADQEVHILNIATRSDAYK